MNLFLAEVTRAAIGTASKMVEYQLRMWGSEGDQRGSGSADKVVAMQPLGVTALPTVARTLRSLCVQVGTEIISLGSFDKQNRPSGLATNEIRFHGLARVAAALRIIADGTIYIDAESGKDIVLNGGTNKVVRVGDDVDMGTFTFLPGTGGATLSWTPPGGGSPVSITTGSNLTAKGKTGADHVKA